MCSASICPDGLRANGQLVTWTSKRTCFTESSRSRAPHGVAIRVRRLLAAVKVKKHNAFLYLALDHTTEKTRLALDSHAPYFFVRALFSLSRITSKSYLMYR